MEETPRAPSPRTQRAPTGVTSRIALALLSLASLRLALCRFHSFLFTLLAAHAVLLSPRLTRLLLLRRLSGIRSLHDHDHDYEHAAASNLRLCRRPGIRSRYEHDHDQGIRSRHDHDSGIRSHYDYEHEHDPSARIRSC